jgi:hypothetical protein
MTGEGIAVAYLMATSTHDGVPARAVLLGKCVVHANDTVIPIKHDEWPVMAIHQ